VEADVFNMSGCSTAFPTGMTGSNTNYFTIGSKKVAIWKGVYDSLEITQATSLDTTSVFFVVHVKIKNTGHIGRNVYYMRTVDPDNAEPETGVFTTHNRIDYQLPNASNKVLVSTWGLTSVVVPNAYLGLGTIDTAAKCFIIKAGLAPNSAVPLDSLYGGYGGNGDTLHNKFYDSNENDVGIGLVFKIGHLVPVDSAIISYAYAFKRGADLDSALAATRGTFPDPSDTTTDTTTAVHNIAGNAGSNIKIYPNPATSQLTVSGLTPGDAVSVYDMMGKRAIEWHVANSSNNNFNLGNLPPGMYILRVTDQLGNIRTKIPMQKL
jgi:hypothetical protein